MARKRKTRTRSTSREIVVRPRVTVASPAVRTARSLARRARPAVRRGASKIQKLALGEKHTLAAVGASAVLAYLDAKGSLQHFPKVGPLDQKAVLGLGLWAVGKYTKNPTAQHLATGVLSISAYEMVQTEMAREAANAAINAAAQHKVSGYGSPFEDEDDLLGYEDDEF